MVSQWMDKHPFLALAVFFGGMAAAGFAMPETYAPTLGLVAWACVFGLLVFVGDKVWPKRRPPSL